MGTDFTLTPHADHLHVELRSQYDMTSAGGTALCVAISDACAPRQLRRVLIEGSVVRRTMGTLDAFGLGSLLGSLLGGTSLACCFYGYTPDHQTQFFQDVAGNRGVRIQFFSDRAAALGWLGVNSQP